MPAVSKKEVPPTRAEFDELLRVVNGRLDDLESWKVVTTERFTTEIDPSLAALASLDDEVRVKLQKNLLDSFRVLSETLKKYVDDKVGTAPAAKEDDAGFLNFIPKEIRDRLLGENGVITSELNKRFGGAQALPAAQQTPDAAISMLSRTFEQKAKLGYANYLAKLVKTVEKGDMKGLNELFGEVATDALTDGAVTLTHG